MLDFEVQRFTRVCAVTGRELQPGESFYSYLIRDRKETERRDVAKDAWTGPPDECLGWWRSEVPDPKSKQIRWAPHEVMLHYFDETEDQPAQADLRFVLALLLVRRRILRLEATEHDEAGSEVMLLYAPRQEIEYRVPVLELSPERAREVQQILSKLLVDAGSR